MSANDRVIVSSFPPSSSFRLLLRSTVVRPIKSVAVADRCTAALRRRRRRRRPYICGVLSRRHRDVIWHAQVATICAAAAAAAARPTSMDGVINDGEGTIRIVIKRKGIGRAAPAAGRQGRVDLQLKDGE